MNKSILYYANDTQTLYFNNDDMIDNENHENRDNSVFIICSYLFGLYHLSIYIINAFKKFRNDDMNNRLSECRVIFRILNENLNLFDKDNIENMHTSQLLDNTLEFFQESNEYGISYKSKQDYDNDTGSNNCNSYKSKKSDENNNSYSKEEIKGAKNLMSMGKNWEFSQ